LLLTSVGARGIYIPGNIVLSVPKMIKISSKYKVGVSEKM